MQTRHPTEEIAEEWLDWHCQVYVLGTRNGCIRYTDLPGFRPLLPA